MKVVVVNAYGRSNRGDSVLLDECLEEIRSAFPNSEISVALFQGRESALSVHPSVNWTLRIGNSVGRGVLGRLASLFYLAVATFSILSNLRIFERLLPSGQRETLDRIRDCQILVSAPGGYIHDTNFAYVIALLHIYFGTRLKKKVVLAPQSIGPIDGLIARFFLRRILMKVSFVCPRESYSRDFLLDVLKLDSKLVYSAGDSAFWNDDVESSVPLINNEWRRLGLEEHDRVFGLSVVGWSFPKSSNPSSDYIQYVKSVAAICDVMSSQHGLVPVIMNQVSDDIETALAVQKAAKFRVVVDMNDHEPWILRALIAKSLVFMGTRFHSCIFSIMAGRPTYAIAYLPKTRYIMEDLGLESRYVLIDQIDVDVLAAKLSSDVKNNCLASADISAAVTSYRDKFSRLQDVLRRVA